MRLPRGAPIDDEGLRNAQAGCKGAMQQLLALTPFQRTLVLCWFCDGCGEEIAAGESHECEFIEKEPGDE